MEYLSLLLTLMNACGSESAGFDHPLQLNYVPSDQQCPTRTAEQVQCVMPRFVWILNICTRLQEHGSRTALRMSHHI
jgi:hypothetical protein